jgi:hypothetical protein
MEQAAGRANRNTVPATDTQSFRLGNRGGIFARGEVDQFGRADSTAEAILAAGLLVHFDENTADEFNSTRFYPAQVGVI